MVLYAQLFYINLYSIADIYIRESVLEIISLKYMQKFKKGGCVPSPNTTNFQDGELCSAFEINSVSRPYGQNSNSAPPAPPKIPEPSPPPSLSSANGTTTDSCTESTGSEHNIEHAQPTRLILGMVNYNDNNNPL